jgi:hypothetical protein
MSAAEAALRAVLSEYAGDPVGYAEEVLGATLTPDQRDIPRLAFAPPHRLLCPSANKVGKTFAAGWLVNHHYDSHDPGVCLVTSSSFRSVKTQVFKEVRRLRPLGRDLMPRAPEIFGRDDHKAIGFSTNNPDAFQGHHEAHWLLLMDEATGVAAEIADRAETMFSAVPGHAWICFYNPNDPTTWPYAAEQSGGWAVKRLSALDHPNLAAELRGLEPPFPGAVRLHRVEARILKECEDCGDRPDEGCFRWPPDGSPARAAPFDRPRWWKPVKPEFDPQVRGRWPAQAMASIWSEEDRRRCGQRAEVDPNWPVQIGVDVSRFGGDRTTFAVRKGTALVWLEERTHWPTRQVSRHVAERLRELCHLHAPGRTPEERKANARKVPCLIDDTGGYGSGVTDYPEGYYFVGVNSSSAAAEPKRYPNRRSELWFATRLAADQGGFHTGDCPQQALVETLWQELLSCRYSLDAKNRRVAEGKASVKERLRRSPDLADALNLAWLPPG